MEQTRRAYRGLAPPERREASSASSSSRYSTGSLQMSALGRLQAASEFKKRPQKVQERPRRLCCCITAVLLIMYDGALPIA